LKTWREDVRELTPSARSLLFMLMSKYKSFSRNKKLSGDGSFYYSDQRLADEIFVSTRTISRAKTALARHGYIKIAIGTSKGHATKYWIITKHDKMSCFNSKEKDDYLSVKNDNLSFKASQNVRPNKINKDINKSDEINSNSKEDNQEAPEMTDEIVNAIQECARLMGKDFAYNSYVDRGFDSKKVKKALDLLTKDGGGNG